MGGSDGRQETSIAAATSRVCTVAQISVPPPTTTDLRASRAAGSSAPAYVPRERFVPPWKQRALERRRASKWRQRRILAQIFGLSGGLTLFAGYVTATPSPAQIWQAVVSHITPNLDREHFRGVGQTIQALTGSFVTPNRVAIRDALTRDGPSWRDATQSGSDPSARFTATVTVDLVRRGRRHATAGFRLTSGPPDDPVVHLVGVCTTTDLRASRAAGSSAPAYVPRERFVPPWKQRAL
ncbi:MAG: hypothetical protein EBU21_16825, partial [Proteobacteria bacterium]|nr:hypothetical protein [Pseudomonadota bacterium]